MPPMPERTDHIVPTRMDNVDIFRLEELRVHLHQLQHNPSIPFHVKLFGDVELQLTEDNTPPLVEALLPPLTCVLKSTDQDPTPCIDLTIKLLSSLNFTSALAIADAPSLITALNSPLPGANLLALAIIHKAAAAPADVATLCENPEMIGKVIQLWLGTEDTGVAAKCSRVLGDLLETDCVIPPRPAGSENGANGVNGHQTNGHTVNEPGRGCLWDFMLHNDNVLLVIHHFCDLPFDTRSYLGFLNRPISNERTTPRATSNAQGRLLRLLPRLAALNIQALLAKPELSSPHLSNYPGILLWASLGMVDRGDDLLYLNLLDFYETLVSVMRCSDRRTSATDAKLKELVQAATSQDEKLKNTLKSLPDRTVEEEAEPLREFITELLH